jgi:hypothetical protein
MLNHPPTAPASTHPRPIGSATAIRSFPPTTTSTTRSAGVTPSSSQPTTGTATQTATHADTQQPEPLLELNSPTPDQIVGQLRLVGQDGGPDHRIQWAEDAVDNEGMGKKKSKSMCSST